MSDLDREALRTRWEAERPAYDRYRKQLQKDIESVLKERGLKFAAITGRTKEVDSFVRKFDLHAEKTSYESVTDKAGIRVVVYLREHVDPVVRALTNEFGVPDSRIDDKRVFPDKAPDRFTYRAVHLQILGQRNGKLKSKECEVQVRTVCEDAWAVMSHFLAYKPEIPVPDDVRRTQAALSAVMELADRQYANQYSTLREQASYGMRDVLDQAEAIFQSLTGTTDFDRDVTEAVLNWLRPAWGSMTPAEIIAAVCVYADAHGGGFAKRVAERRSSPNRSAYLLAPEALLVAERFDAGLGETVRELWFDHLPEIELTRLGWDLGLADEE